MHQLQCWPEREDYGPLQVIEYFDDVTNFFLVMELCTGLCS